MINGIKKVLCLSPHSDDIELGCGGTISRFIEEGKEIYSAIFSFSRKSIPSNFPQDITYKESEESANLLGIDKNHLIRYNYSTRHFHESRQEILENLYVLNRDLNPDIVFLPSPQDTHQDHEVISKEGFRAFKNTTILGYEIPWNNLNFQTQYFVFLKEKHIEMKINAINCYMSQIAKRNDASNYTKHLAKVRGTQIGTEYAECFEIVRAVLKL